MIGGDHRGAATKPTEGFTERKVVVERKITTALIVFFQVGHQGLVVHLFAEMRGRGVGGIPWTRHIVFPD
jgi:hypothetical protein